MNTLIYMLRFSFAKNWSIFFLFLSSFSAKTVRIFEFPDYSFCGLIMSKLNDSVHTFFIRTVNRLRVFHLRAKNSLKSMNLESRKRNEKKGSRITIPIGKIIQKIHKIQKKGQ